MNAETFISQLELTAHPEGGYYKETYRSEEIMTTRGNERNVSTAIYFLLKGDQVSKFHRIRSDETWHFHCGDPLEIIWITESGNAVSRILGLDLKNGEEPQITVPAGLWFGSRIPSKKGYSLVSCTVAPGFDFTDFSLADREALLAEYPGNEQLIKELT